MITNLTSINKTKMVMIHWEMPPVERKNKGVNRRTDRHYDYNTPRLPRGKKWCYPKISKIPGKFFFPNFKNLVKWSVKISNAMAWHKGHNIVEKKTFIFNWFLKDELKNVTISSTRIFDYRHYQNFMKNKYFKESWLCVEKNLILEYCTILKIYF